MKQTFAPVPLMLFLMKRALLLLAVAVTVTGCKESISDEDYAIADGQTIYEYLSSSEDFTLITALYERVHLGRTEEGSPLSSVLSARGNYTVFAPTDSAVHVYLDSIGVASIDELSDDDAELIAKSCIIDNGDADAYESADFPTEGSFAESNMNDRILTCAMDTIDNDIVYVINGSSPVVNADNDLTNGIVHVVSVVVSPSSDNVGERIIAADNMKIMGYLLTQTHWTDSLTKYIDQDYEEQYYEEVTDYRLASETSTVIYQNTSRYYGYTGLIETDDVYANEWGINLVTDEDGEVTNWKEVMDIITQKCQEVYGTEDANDLTSADNAINRFVAYHFLYGSMAYDRFVHHCNEYDYKYGSNILDPQTSSYPVNVWDYYTTMGQHRGLIKITQVGDEGFEADLEHTIYINRISTYNDTRTGDYRETGVKEAGIVISASNGDNDNNALNGFYYPIDHILMYTDEVRENLAGERMRIDVVTMHPEIASNNNRGCTNYRLFPNGYFSNILNETTSTVIIYLMDQGGGSWNDYQGDEFLVCGLYDFTMRIPPVPVTGTYELRMGVGMNAMRGMCQIYFGDDPLRMTPVGLPYDMRQSVSASNAEIPWEEDTGDEITDAENDKDLRNHGYLKGPQYYTITNGQANTPVRARGGSVACIRRIITQATLEADKEYYLRFKSVLRKTDSQFFMDYFELVPSAIYNGVQEEDIW